MKNNSEMPGKCAWCIRLRRICNTIYVVLLVILGLAIFGVAKPAAMLWAISTSLLIFIPSSIASAIILSRCDHEDEGEEDDE